MGKEDFCDDSDMPKFLRGKSPVQKGLAIAGMVILGIIAAVAFAAVFGWVVMLLWNWLMPMLFGLKTIGYWEAFGVLLLSKIIFSGFHSGGGGKDDDKDSRHFKRWMKHEWEGAPAREDWKGFKDYWKDKGKTDFDEYMKSKKETKTE